jgi:hypothetical protein
MSHAHSHLLLDLSQDLRYLTRISHACAQILSRCRPKLILLGVHQQYCSYWFECPRCSYLSALIAIIS